MHCGHALESLHLDSDAFAPELYSDKLDLSQLQELCLWLKDTSIVRCIDVSFRVDGEGTCDREPCHVSIKKSFASLTSNSFLTFSLDHSFATVFNEAICDTYRSVLSLLANAKEQLSMTSISIRILPSASNDDMITIRPISPAS